MYKYKETDLAVEAVLTNGPKLSDDGQLSWGRLVCAD